MITQQDIDAARTQDLSHLDREQLENALRTEAGNGLAVAATAANAMRRADAAEATLTRVRRSLETAIRLHANDDNPAARVIARDALHAMDAETTDRLRTPGFAKPDRLVIEVDGDGDLTLWREDAYDEHNVQPIMRQHENPAVWDLFVEGRFPVRDTEDDA